MLRAIEPTPRMRSLAVPVWAAALLASLAAEAEPTPFVGHGGPVKGIAAAEAGLATAGFDYSVVLWNPATGMPRLRLMGHRGPVNDVAFAPSGRFLSSTGDDGRLGIWDLATGRPRALARGHEAKAVAVALSPDGRMAATAGWDGRVLLWRVPEAEQVASFGAPPLRYTGVAFAAGGRKLAASDQEGALTLWDLETRRLLWRSDGNGFPITRLLSRGEILLTGSIDGTIRGWSVEDGRELFRLEGQEKPVLSLAATTDGGRIASGTAAGTIYIWNARDLASERVLRSAGGPVWALAFAADGRTLYSGHGDGALRVWDAERGDQLAGPTQTWITETQRIAAHTGAPKLFGKCRLCHSLTPDSENKSGPTFYGLIGRRVGSLPDYPYSEALRRADVVWTEETLTRLFELGPDRYLPGTKMPLQRIANRREIEELVRWLVRVTSRVDGRNAQAEERE